MGIPKNKSFTFYYNGQCASGFAEPDVRQGLAKLFGVSQAEVVPIFSGEAVFLITDLNSLSLGQFKRAFDTIGARYRYWEQIDQAPAAEAPPATQRIVPLPPSDNRPCPKCGATAANDTECVACGIVFDKYRHAQERLATEQKAALAVEEKDDFEDTGYHPDTRRAKHGILLGSTLLVLVFLIDEFAQSRGIDIGYWPYLLSNLCFLYGAWYFAKQRGYGFLVRMLGLFNLIGISLIYLLPDRTTTNRAKGSKLKASASAIAAIIIGILWIHQHYQSRTALKLHLEYYDTIQMREGTYPSGSLLEDVAQFHQHHDAMYRFVEHALMTLDENSFRPDKVGRIGDTLFAALAEYFVWLNYQRYLGAQAYEELPEHLTSEAITRQRRAFKDLVMCYAKGEAELIDEPRFAKAFQDWTMDCHTWDVVLVQCTEPGTERSDMINAYLWQLYDHFREQMYRQKLTRETYPAQTGSSLPNYSERIFSSVEMDDAGIIELHLTRDEAGKAALSEKYLVMAYYQYPYRRFGKLKATYELACIGGDLAPKYLQGDFNVFHDWIMEEEVRPVRQSTPKVGPTPP